jgi:adenosylcobinamide amidohydrolase
MIAIAPASRFVAPILDGKRLFVSLGAPHRCLSWAIVNGGLVQASAVEWRQVDDGEEVYTFSPGAIGLLTARRLDAFEEQQTDEVRCAATVGLGNALAAGDPPGRFRPIGTINVLVQLARPLADAALVEACALAAEARTAAVLEARVPSRVSGRPATGTGTDCIVIAAPVAVEGERWVGKHTALGAQIGATVREATARGVAAWLAELRR